MNTRKDEIMSMMKDFVWNSRANYGYEFEFVPQDDGKWTVRMNGEDVEDLPVTYTLVVANAMLLGAEVARERFIKEDRLIV